MSTAANPNTMVPTSEPLDAHGDHHDPHLAHHFDTPEQQMASTKLGMWVFLGTEVLMFGGLFCAYAIYRNLHPEAFVYGANEYLDTKLGALNTIVLITSSLTMAWGVRAAQLNQTKLLIGCLILTLMGAGGFMVIKSVEYTRKYNEHVFPGKYNMYNAEYKGEDKAVMTPKQTTVVLADLPVDRHLRIPDGNAGTANESKIKPHFYVDAGMAEESIAPKKEKLEFKQLSAEDRAKVNSFFSVYFLMTGLHGVHVLVGMVLISWLLVRALKNEFSSNYFTPVDMVGLYWHLVDLIWIFLFPLLYLIK